MARTPSWLPRAHEIRRRVAGSQQSHYTRKELEELFQIQQSPATRLMDALPTVRMNMGLLVERESLLAFLERVEEADDVTALMAKMRADKKAPSRRRMRSLVRRQFGPVSFDGMPANLQIERGRLTIEFDSIDKLVETAFFVAQLLNDELDEFARRYEPIVEKEPDEDAEELRRLFAELR